MFNDMIKMNTGYHGVLGFYDYYWGTEKKTKYSYTFHNHFHPYVSELLEQLNRKSIDGLLDSGFHNTLKATFFNAQYQPTTNDVTIDVTSFPKEIDVSEFGAYSIYNWELLFHIPLSIAVHLSKNQRFEEAQKWFHYIFDPTTNDGQYWRFIGFQGKSFKQVDQLLRLVSKPNDECTAEELQQKQFVLSSYEQLRANPFQPHVVARMRFLAYQYCVVMKYLDNLISWGDSLFRQDTIETLNEATQIYVLASNILGEKPQRIPNRGRVQTKTFAQLRQQGIDQLGNALVELEGQFPFNLYFPGTSVDTSESNALFGIGRTLYFCIPRNEKLLSYWDIVADRLFKIRHCMNIEGVVRQLPLFEPPIDPGMLVKAAAAGINIGNLISGLNQPLSPVRSTFLIQKALEICSEVRSMGSSLLSAMEKQDTEAMSLLRQKHEINIQKLTQDVRYLQWKEAESATETLLRTRDSAVERYNFYQRLLGSETKASEVNLTRRGLTEENFDEMYSQLVTQYEDTIDLEDYPDLEVLDAGKLYLNTNEDSQLNSHLPTARDTRLAASIVEAIGAAVVFIPDADGNLHFWGLGGSIKIPIGTAISKSIEIGARILNMIAAWEQDQAGMAGLKAGYERRADDWRLQNNLAARELMQIGRQIISSLLREQITYLEYRNIQTQIEQAEEVEEFLQSKFTNEALYGWMQGQLSKLYFDYYKFAFDIARRAEQTMKQEVMRQELDERDFIKFNYWDGGRKGLLSGEALHLDLKRMEMAYHEHNKREYELIKHISLRQLNPIALLMLKATGVCELTIPEWVFDLDTAGHYMRRIKTVSVSIPAVTGPYTSINCTLSLQKSTVRKSSILGDEYTRLTDEEDTRFIDYYGTIQSIVTSSGQNDSGLYETNLRDERFLPFEGHGVISTWQLRLSEDFRQFDYNSIADVVLHIRYTAREGGGLLRSGAVEYLHGLVEDANASGLVQFFSLRHDFPTEWHQYVTGDQAFTATIKQDYFPYLAQGNDISLNSINIYAIQDSELAPGTIPGLDLDTLTNEMRDNNKIDLSIAEGDLMVRSPDSNAFVVIKYSLSA